METGRECDSLVYVPNKEPVRIKHLSKFNATKYFGYRLNCHDKNNDRDLYTVWSNNCKVSFFLFKLVCPVSTSSYCNAEDFCFFLVWKPKNFLSKYALVNGNEHFDQASPKLSVKGIGLTKLLLLKFSSEQPKCLECVGIV